MAHQAIPVTPIPALRGAYDNYVWLFPTGEGQVAAVDPGEAGPVLAHLKRENLMLTHILITHHHADHTGGVEEIQRSTGAYTIGSVHDRHRLPVLDRMVDDGDTIQIGPHTMEVMHTPGHTTGHVVYLLEDLLFCGDTLFSYGAGRLFEGTPTQMWKTMKRLRALPDQMRACPAHEYTLTNLTFCADLEPDNREIAELKRWAMGMMDRDEPTLPNLMEKEKRLNPFLRCDEPTMAALVGLEGVSPPDVLAEVRARRNQY
ncbi:MAG: hydroxyacylglutathione hydrolase [Magnetococcales bacterium]|nr:hydroxyacylglutathione hydrolase [Magnetococcales bacterium]